MSILGIPNVDPDLEKSLSSGRERVEELLLSHVKSEYPFITEASQHLAQAGGKRLRPLLTLLTSHLGSGPTKDIVKAGVVVELTHLATLYHDDVMDEAPLRRGVVSANSRWNNTIAILTGDFLFAKASELLADLGPEAVRIQAKTFERLCTGQILESIGPSEDPLAYYLKVVSDKTGSLIATSAQFGAMLSGANASEIVQVTAFAEKIGIAFQLADDVIDIASDSGVSGKTPGTDLREGVSTLVTLHVMASKDPADDELKQILSQPIQDEKVLEETLQRLRVHPAMAAARNQLHEISRSAKLDLNVLPSSAVSQALASLCDAIIERSA